jgi:hypothetical protein
LLLLVLTLGLFHLLLVKLVMGQLLLRVLGSWIQLHLLMVLMLHLLQRIIIGLRNTNGLQSAGSSGNGILVVVWVQRHGGQRGNLLAMGG